MIKLIKDRFKLIGNPKEYFLDFDKDTFEKQLSDYLKLLILTGILAGISITIFNTIRGFYFLYVDKINVDIWRMLNYSVGNGVAVVFFALFCGTILLFVIATILRPFLKKLKFIKILQLMMYSLSPLLLFGWIPALSLSLLIWCVFIFCIGYKNIKLEHVKKDSIKQRE